MKKPIIITLVTVGIISVYMLINPADDAKESFDPIDQGNIVKVFDELYSSGDFRKIYEKKSEFIVPLIGDPVRRMQFEEAVNKTGTVELLLSQIAEMIEQGSPYAAWEYVLQAELESPHDTKVLQVKADLTVIASEYAAKLRESTKGKE